MGLEAPNPQPSIAAWVLAPAMRGMQALGIDTRPLLERARIPDPEGGQPGGRIPYRRVAALWTHAVAVSGDSTLGLRLAEQLDASQFDLLAYLGRATKDLHEAFEDISRYGSLLADCIGFSLHEEAGHPVLVHRMQGGEAHPAGADYALATVVALVRKALDPAFAPLEVHFERPLPRNTASYRRFFRAPVRFSMSRNALVLGDLARLRSPHGDPSLHRILERLAERELGDRAAPPALDETLRRVIREELPAGRPTARRLAARLGTSERTLRRHLSETGRNLSGLLDEVRMEMSRELLEDPTRSLDETAARLGFSEVSSFHRAFRRWTGTTPNRYRAEHRQGLSELNRRPPGGGVSQ